MDKETPQMSREEFNRLREFDRRVKAETGHNFFDFKSMRDMALSKMLNREKKDEPQPS